MRKHFIVLFFLCLLFAIGIRTWKLVQFPEGFDQTEATFGYNTYSIKNTGRDEDGRWLPLQLNTVGDYKLAGYVYWQIPFVAVLGLNEFSVRLSTAVSGIISLVFLYLIVYRLSRNRKLALLTFFVTAISPWHLILSRMAYEPMTAMMELMAAGWLLLLWKENRRLQYLVLTMLCIAAALATYYAVWVIFPMILLILIVEIYKTIGLTRSSPTCYLTISIPLAMLVILLFSTGGTRISQDSTFQGHAKPLIEEQIREDQKEFVYPVTRFFHNKLVFYPKLLLTQWSRNLSPDFLFVQGDVTDRRFQVPYHGVLYVWYLPFLLLGIASFIRRKSSYVNFLLFFGIAIVFAGSSFSDMGSVTQRTLFASPLFGILISQGVLAIIGFLRRYFVSYQNLFYAFFSLTLALNVSYFCHQYVWHANVHQPWGRDFGMSQMITFIKSKKREYKKIVVPENSYMFFYFYNRTDPHVAWTESATRLDQANYLGMHLRSQIEDYLTMPGECPSQGKLDVLYVCRGNKIPRNANIVHLIRYRDNQPAFIFIEFTDSNEEKALPEHIQFMPGSSIIPEANDNYW